MVPVGAAEVSMSFSVPHRSGIEFLTQCSNLFKESKYHTNIVKGCKRLECLTRKFEFDESYGSLAGDDAGREMLLLHPRWDGQADGKRNI